MHVQLRTFLYLCRAIFGVAVFNGTSVSFFRRTV
ncbi:RAxF-45 family protein [Alteribacter populi]|nr:RAxF-45 family protein [Alteribacter populi]